MTAAVVTVSDSAYRGERADKSGPAVRARLERLGFTVAPIVIVPDERPQIADQLSDLADSGHYAAIFTTGGTGVAMRDITPEATRDVIDREIPGVGETMRTAGLAQTPLSPLSRATAGTRGRVLIVNLPGSPKGAVESLDAIAGLVPHMLQLLSGNTEHDSQRPPKH